MVSNTSVSVYPCFIPSWPTCADFLWSCSKSFPLLQMLFSYWPRLFPCYSKLLLPLLPPSHAIVPLSFIGFALHIQWNCSLIWFNDMQDECSLCPSLQFDAMVPLTVPSIVTISNVIIPLLFSGNLPLVLCLFSMHFQLSAQVITFVHPSYSWSYKNITQKHLENSSHKKHSWWRS